MNRIAHTLFAISLSMVAIITPVWPAAARVVLTVSQQFRAFHPGHATIHAGDTIVILNDDVFVHQIYINSPQMSFESDEQPPGTAIAIIFPRPGTFSVQCHIHPMMQMTVVVQPRPGS